jgi:hypothetical protein
MTSRLQILDYCWRCQQNQNPNFRSHIYTNCVEINMSNSVYDEEDDNEDIIWEIELFNLIDSFEEENDNRINNLNLYFSDDSDFDSNSDIYDENDGDSEEIDINNLMFGFELTKTELDMCAICLEENIKPDNTTTLDCNHTFCNHCYSRIILNCNLVCALCRNPINLKSI